MFILGGAYLCSIKFSFIITNIWTMSKCTLFFSRCACAILLALLSSIFAQASELDSVRTLNLDPNLVWDKISPNDYVLSKDGRTLVKWKNHSVSNLDMEREPRLSKVQFIGDGAFSSDSYSYSLETVVLASSVKSIGSHAFFRCSNLKKMLIPISVTSIGNSAFAMCSNLSRLDIPNSVSYIGEGAFFSCGLKNIVMPSSLKKIENDTFSYCMSLTSVTIPASVTSIGNGAFSKNYELEEVVMPSSVTSIGDYAFDDCYKLAKLAIPKSVTNIGKQAFANCSELSGIELPPSLTRIEEWTFFNCNKLKNIIIPPSVVTIREQAFWGHKDLESVIIPSSVTSIGKDAFSSSFSDVLLNLRFESPKPPYVDDFIASEYSKIKIIVPKGAKEAYIKANLVANAEWVVEE